MTVNFKNILEENSELVDAPSSPQGSVYRSFGKRAFDIILVVATLPLTVPIILICALLVSLDGGQPFYRQKRVGKNGSVFKMWKLRSMVPNAEAQLDAYLQKNPAAKLEWDATQKLKKDPRITRLGRFIRKTSIDELPQLINVLGGEMSLIGPRPMMCSQKVLYKGSAYYRLQPGISGFWQISDRNDSEFKSRALYDLRYDQEMSLKTDITVIFMTFGVVLRGTGY